MSFQRLVVIGVGNMGGAMVRAWLKDRMVLPNQLLLCDPNEAHLVEFSKQEVAVVPSAVGQLQEDDWVLIAIKPQLIDRVLPELSKEARIGQLWISIAAGKNVDSIRKALNHPTLRFIRVMPNLPAQVGQGMSGWWTNSRVDSEEREYFQRMLEAIGEQVKVEQEADLDSLTAVSGSGPAYFFHLAECLAQAAEEFGFSAEVSETLARQTLIGAGALLQQDGISAGEWRERVTSKGGTTEAALQSFAQSNFSQVVQRGVEAAKEKAVEIKGKS